MRLSIITPAFNEEGNIGALYARLKASLERISGEWEWIVIDDHSSDRTFETVRQLTAVDGRVRAIRLARNSGSHVAIACGLHHARGDAAAVMAADLQDPPETLAGMIEAWHGGAQVVWAVRRQRPGEAGHARFATLYYWMMRNVAGLREMPARGADFFLIDRRVIDAFRQCDEPNGSVLGLITWLGFRQVQIEYDKQPRAAGRSGWTLRKKVKLVLDSLTAFSDAPIRWCSYLGAFLMVVGVIVGVVTLLSGSRSGLRLVAVLLFGLTGIQLLAVGLVGEYVWRALAAARKRPLYVVEETAGVGDSLRT